MSWKVVSSSFAFCITLTSLGIADTMIINPSQENTIIQTVSGTQQLSNAEGDLYVGRTNQDGQNPATISIRRGLLKFNIAGAGIPADATITGSTLTMDDVTPGVGGNGNQTLSLHDMLNSWGTGTSYTGGGGGANATNGDATWFDNSYNTNPSLATTWSTPGGDFSSTVVASALDPNRIDAGTITWSSAAMISDVQNWLNGAANDGWLLQGNESAGQTAKRLEGDNPSYDTAYPTLTVSYSVVPEPSTAALAIAGLLAMVVVRFRRSGKPVV